MNRCNKKLVDGWVDGWMDEWSKSSCKVCLKQSKYIKVLMYISLQLLKNNIFAKYLKLKVELIFRPQIKIARGKIKVSVKYKVLTSQPKKDSK